VGRVALLRLSWLSYAMVYAGAALLAAGAPAPLAWLLFLASGAHTALGEGPERALVADLTPQAEMRGTTFGFLHFFKGVMALPATALAAWVWHWAGREWAFVLGAAMACAAVLALPWVGAGRDVSRPDQPA
jgi:hypothetical protein